MLKKISLSKSNSDVRTNRYRDRHQSAVATSSNENRNKQRVTTPNNNNGLTRQWNDVKSGWKKFKLKRWNSIGSWVAIVQIDLTGKYNKQTHFRHFLLLLFPAQSPDSEGTLDLTNFEVSEGNYSKRKHVFRLSSVQGDSNNESELMLQTNSSQELKDWVSSLRTVTRGGTMSESQPNLTVEKFDSSTSTTEDSLNASFPQKAAKKYHFGSRSPSGQSPVFKSRKAPSNLLMPPISSNSRDSSDKETNSPKQKSWKSFVTNQFKKMQPSNESSSSNESSICYLTDCTPSEEDPHVPLLVAKCTHIVETKGLGIVGIYRIPGNTAAISGLYENIKNNGFNEQTLNDAKWDDVNVVSSLLKLFIRSLTEPILPNNLYQCFIAADKNTVEEQRFQELRSLLKKFPPHHYATLKHLIGHLSKVSSNSSVNLMEPRNLGEIF